MRTSDEDRLAELEKRCSALEELIERLVYGDVPRISFVFERGRAAVDLIPKPSSVEGVECSIGYCQGYEGIDESKVEIKVLCSPKITQNEAGMREAMEYGRRCEREFPTVLALSRITTKNQGRKP